VCRGWQELTGDAGWGGILADWFEKDPNRQVYVIVEPGMDLIPLIAETIALLPPERRWQVTFSTYFTGLPQGIPCLWRCVMKDSPEATNAGRLRGQQVLNLCEPLGQAPVGNLVEVARSGRRTGRVTVPAKEPESLRAWPGHLDAGLQPDDQGTLATSPAWKQASYEVEPISSNPGFPQKSSPSSSSVRSEPLSKIGRASSLQGRRGKKNWLWPAVVGSIGGIGIGMLIASLLWRATALTAGPLRSLPNENGGNLSTADEKEMKTLAKQVSELNEKNQAKEKEFKEANSSLIKTKDALAKETERRAKLEMEKKEKEKTIAGLQDDLRKEKESKEFSNAKPDPSGTGVESRAATIAEGYLRLPDWSRSSINENKLKTDKSVKNFGPEPGKDYNLKLFVMDSSNLEPVEGVSSIKVRLRGENEFAKFELKDGRLLFQWHPQAEDKYEAAQALLRDCILEIGSAGKSRMIALREPVSEKEIEINFPPLGKLGTQDVYRNSADFMTWDSQGRPSQDLLFDLVRIEIDNKESSLKQNSLNKKPIQTVLFEDSVKPFKWGVIGRPQDSDHVGSLTLGPSNPLRRPSKVRILSLVACIEVHGVYVEVARIGKSGKK
jgi:hypothetical protein